MEIKGSVTSLLYGMENNLVDDKDLIGLPINGPDGNKVGEVTEIEYDPVSGNKLFVGEIYDTNIGRLIMSLDKSSFEIVTRKLQEEEN